MRVVFEWFCFSHTFLRSHFGTYGTLIDRQHPNTPDESLLWTGTGCTFVVLSGGADVHPLLTLATAHQETSHRLSGQEGIRLRYLRAREGGKPGGAETA